MPNDYHPAVAEQSWSNDPWERFELLSALRRDVEPILGKQRESLAWYYTNQPSPGFRHKDPKGTRATASTATCTASLQATGKWLPSRRESPPDWIASAPRIADDILNDEWTSSGLTKDNPFTTSFVLEGASLLVGKPTAVQETHLVRARNLLLHGNQKGISGLDTGFLSVEFYRPSSFVTHLALRAVRACNRVILAKEGLTAEQKVALKKEARREVTEQTFLLTHRSRVADPLELAYGAILVAELSPAPIQPDDMVIIRGALATFFAAQLPDGAWPLGQPLFTYPKVGPAYCYDYELLTALLSEPSLRTELLAYIPQLERAARRAILTAIPTGETTIGWTSGHHRHINQPESWSTAAAFHFLYALDLLLAEAIRQAVFKALRQSYLPPSVPSKDSFAHGMLDAPSATEPGALSLRQQLERLFIDPLRSQLGAVAAGHSFEDSTATVAAFFGPPGTSKTKLAGYVAKALGWPLLVVDPSHFLRAGMDRVHAEAERVFLMLGSLEQCVVLLDEVDELVRNRVGEDQMASRFLTTAMLPRLSELRGRRRIVLLAATNFIELFDAAIGRLGRFDAVVQVLPPTAQAKAQEWPELQPLAASRADKLGWLTYLECETLAKNVKAAPQDAVSLLEDAYATCVANQEQGAKGSPKWLDAAKKEKINTRWPSPPVHLVSPAMENGIVATNGR